MPVTELKCYGCKRTWEVDVPQEILDKYLEFKKTKPNFGQLEEANILGKCRRCKSGKIVANPAHAPAVIWRPTGAGRLLDPDMTETEAEDALFNSITDEPDE